jgi:cell wall-associated NlpC family hydrolase
LWGGKSQFGIDCSGFTQLVFKLNGIKLKRDAWQQAESGSVIQDFKSANENDLAFFHKENKITHVGIIMKNNQIIHASGKVRIDRIDEKGIFNEELNKYTHQLNSIKRVS